MPDWTHEDTPRLMAIYDALDGMHAWRGWHWWPDADPFEVAVGCILVQNTAWTNVEHALDRLRAAHALDFATMQALPQSSIEDFIRPSGQYRQKAKKLRAFFDLVNVFGSVEGLFSLPANQLRDALLKTWGIGPETADAMVLYASRQPALVMDAYTMRLMSRLGTGTSGTDYHTWQRWFAERLPSERDLQARYHSLIVMHCKHTCQKLRPKCGECTLLSQCPYGQGEARG
jgi:endonuclease-3 related protein